MRIAGIYLAAGQSRRMGYPKVSANLTSDLPLGRAALLELIKLDLEMLIVVVRPGESLDWMPEGGGGSQYSVLVCGDAHEGMSRSIRCALREIAVRSEGESVDAVLITLADNPFITSTLLEGWINEFRNDPSLVYIAAKWLGNPMPPVLWSRFAFDALSALEGDKGGRHFILSEDYKGLLIPIDEVTAMDVDTPADLTLARNWWKS